MYYLQRMQRAQFYTWQAERWHGEGECMLFLYCRRERENEWIFNPLDLINKQDIIPVYEEEWGWGHMASPSPANVAISLH